MPITLRSRKDALQLSRSFNQAANVDAAARLLETLQTFEAAGGTQDTYVSAVIEAAASVARLDRDDVRAFAKYFVGQTSKIAQSRAGLAAIMFEAFVLTEGGNLRQQFVETVVEAKSDTFLAVFRGPLAEQERARVLSATSEFARLKSLVDAGAISYDLAEVMEFTVFEGTPTLKANAAQILPKTTVNQHDGTTISTRAVSLSLPANRAAYEAEVERGGVSNACMAFLIAEGLAEPYGQTEEGSPIVVDTNGYKWCSAQGAAWVPLLAEEDDEEDDEETDGEEDEEEVADEDEAVEEEFVPDDSREEVNTHAIVEDYSDSGALRSRFGTWAVFESALSDGEVSTIVTARSAAWAVSAPLRAVRDLVESMASKYIDLPAEGDLMIEAMLAEFADDHGVKCENEADVRSLVEAKQANGPTREDRDYAVRQGLAVSDIGAHFQEANNTVESVEFVERAGGNALQVAFDAGAGYAGVVELEPFDEAGRPLSNTLCAVLREADEAPRRLWLNQAGSLSEVTSGVLGFLGSVCTLSEADEKDAADDEEEEPATAKKEPVAAGK